MGDYKEVICPKDAIASGCFGQSISSNYVFSRHYKFIPGKLFQFIWSTGRCYEYKESAGLTD